jgi:Peptidase family M1 domain
MKKVVILIFGFGFGFGFGLHPLQSQIINQNPLSKRITGYKMEVELNPVTKTIDGIMDAFWVNPSNNAVPDIQLHMYLNAFRSNKSTFYREKESEGSPGTKEIDFGWIDIKSMTDKKGNDLKSVMKFISPDDNNPDDMTVVDVPLAEAVRPGDTVFIKVNFVSKLPSRIRRTGFNDDFFFVAQWFPKFGVYEPAGMRYAVKGGWNCHQFHNHSEFYSNHSLYDVKISVPKEYVVGTGGMLLDEKETSEGKKIQTWRAEDIVDFAWTAWPGYAVFTDQWKNVKIRLLIPKGRENQVTRQFIAVKNAFEYFNENVGPYPWPYLTIVVPPVKGAGAEGMEYTTIFTSSSAYGLPGYLLIPEMYTIHEFGHVYFMGILASNEFEEPWLDEGVNSFWEERILDHYYGPDAGLFNHPFLKIADETMGRMDYVRSGSRQVISNAEYSWNYPHGTYGIMSYMKTATWLYTLMGIIGEETMNEVFREYYKEWAFRHPSGKDFVNVVNEVVSRIHGNKFGPDMNWFFDQTLYGTGICDYRVAGFYNSRLTDFTGIADEGNSLIFKKSEKDKDSVYIATVQLERLGEVMLPEEVLVHFDNGDQILETWDGKSRYKDFTYTGNRQVDWVKIDPEYKIRMDINYINNSMTADPDRKPLRRYTNKFISFLQFLISFVSL